MKCNRIPDARFEMWQRVSGSHVLAVCPGQGRKSCSTQTGAQREPVQFTTGACESQGLILPFTHCMDLGKPPNLSKGQFLYLSRLREEHWPCLGFGNNQIIHVEVMYYLGRGLCSVLVIISMSVFIVITIIIRLFAGFWRETEGQYEESPIKRLLTKAVGQGVGRAWGESAVSQALVIPKP